ncbi:hypothetical protein ACRRVD_03205 [Candidatus Cardinium hertigii]|uniref:hypothetical protein n=1 Tax=Candidatus Cardinium hertigii TaxID=247481 RepID=UPI003D7CFCF7
MNVENFITSVVDKYIKLNPYEISTKEIKNIDHEKYIKSKKELIKIACKMIVIGHEKDEITKITGIYNENLEKLESIFNTKIL